MTGQVRGLGPGLALVLLLLIPIVALIVISSASVGGDATLTGSKPTTGGQMPFQIEEVRERTKKVTKAYRGGQKLTLEYRLDRFTVEEQTAYEDELAAISRKDEHGNLVSLEPNKELADKLTWYLEQIIVSADWEDKEGAIPIEAEAMKKRLPPGVLMFAVEMIGENKTGK